MPTYNYKCNNCESVSSAFKRISESPLKVCNECEGELKRVISGGTALIFKGEGFYLTDNKTKNSDSKNENLKIEKSYK